MPIPKTIARINRYALNPAVRRFAGRVPGFAIVRHRGRRSGRVYDTPVNIFSVEEGFVVALTYGADAEWVRNVVAEGGCTIRHRGWDLRLSEPVFLSTRVGMAAMPIPVRLILGMLDVTDFLHMRIHAGSLPVRSGKKE